MTFAFVDREHTTASVATRATAREPAPRSLSDRGRELRSCNGPVRRSCGSPEVRELLIEHAAHERIAFDR